MKQQELSRRIQNINRLLGRIEQIIYSLQRLDSDMYPNDYLALCTEAALLSERATCLIRNIVYATSGQRRSMYLGHAASTQEIHIFYHEGIFEVHLPVLLPHKQGKLSSQFLFDPLNTALTDFMLAASMPKFRECTICICHSYDAKISQGALFDYDNLQLKQLIDVIATHILTDDNAKLCNVYHSCLPSDKDCTKVYVMPKDTFPKWLLLYETAEKLV